MNDIILDLIDAAEDFLAACDEEKVPTHLRDKWYRLSATTADARAEMNP